MGKSKRQVEELLARYFPKPDVPPSVRKLPVARAMPTLSDATRLAPSDTPGVAPVPSPPLPGACLKAPPAAPRRPVVSPLAPDRYEIRFTASAQTREKLRLAQDLLRHAIPSGDLAEIIDRALTVLLADLARKKFGATERPRASRGTAPGSRDVAAKVRRVVWPRDHGTCTFVSKNGRRCNERAFIEFDHIHPHGARGEGTTDNIRLLCRAHNAYHSELFYGHGHPGERGTRPGKSTSPPP